MIICVLHFVYLWPVYLKGILGDTENILREMLSVELNFDLGVTAYPMGHWAVSETDRLSQLGVRGDVSDIQLIQTRDTAKHLNHSGNGPHNKELLR